MHSIEIILILSISFIILVILKKDEKKGICVSIFCLILMPRELYIQFGGGLPTLTVYRAILIIVMIYFYFLRKGEKSDSNKPFLNVLLLILAQKAISLFFAFDFRVALNGFLVFGVQVVLFFYFMLIMINDRKTIESVPVALTAAILAIAAIGFIERYTGFNPVDYITSPGSPRLLEHRTLSTLSHPIHFGTILAMGWPICLFVLDQQTTHAKKRLMWILLLFIYAGLYFSGSRGPWVGFVLAALLLLFFKFSRIKTKLAFILSITAAILILRPGVYHSIHGMYEATLDQTSLEGGSFYYRFDLFRRAHAEISKSILRLAFGYGDGAHHSMDLTAEVSYRPGEVRSFWSWDSEFALILLEGGYLGFILNLILYLSMAVYLIRNMKIAEGEDRNILIAVIACVAVFVFMMTNVAIFSPQLHFMVWTSIAIGVNISNRNLKVRKI